jgi:hypothetical protein
MRIDVVKYYSWWKKPCTTLLRLHHFSSVCCQIVPRTPGLNIATVFGGFVFKAGGRGLLQV